MADLSTRDSTGEATTIEEFVDARYFQTESVFDGGDCHLLR